MSVIPITNELLDLSQLVGFKKMVFIGVRGVSYTPKVALISWKESKQKVLTYLENFEYVHAERKKECIATLVPHTLKKVLLIH